MTCPLTTALTAPSVAWPSRTPLLFSEWLKHTLRSGSLPGPVFTQLFTEGPGWLWEEKQEHEGALEEAWGLRASGDLAMHRHHGKRIWGLSPFP